ncbi:MAG: type II toxin-antitoxin system VapC family toxin [Bradymonadales bacterium]|nr:type II toxin-antitoxin system VapC family toxin [Bradymonadales bacterium]
MILFLDTSALVKLYVTEEGSTRVREQLAGCEQAAISRVAYPEARAALARRHREGGVTAEELRTAVEALDRDLGAFVVVEMSQRVAQMAGDLAEKHGLRGFDAIHLASAIELYLLTGSRILFLSHDTRQLEAARQEGMA